MFLDGQSVLLVALDSFTATNQGKKDSAVSKVIYRMTYRAIPKKLILFTFLCSTFFGGGGAQGRTVAVPCVIMLVLVSHNVKSTDRRSE